MQTPCWPTLPTHAAQPLSPNGGPPRVAYPVVKINHDRLATLAERQRFSAWRLNANDVLLQDRLDGQAAFVLMHKENISGSIPISPDDALDHKPFYVFPVQGPVEAFSVFHAHNFFYSHADERRPSERRPSYGNLHLNPRSERALLDSLYHAFEAYRCYEQTLPLLLAGAFRERCDQSPQFLQLSRNMTHASGLNPDSIDHLPPKMVALLKSPEFQMFGQAWIGNLKSPDYDRDTPFVDLICLRGIRVAAPTSHHGWLRAMMLYRQLG